MLNLDEPRAKKVILWGSERDIFKGAVSLRAKARNRLTNKIMLNAFLMTEDDMEHYVWVINSYKPTIIRGYAGSLYELAKYIERKKKAIFTPTVIVSSAETLRREIRQKVESVFGTKVYNFYGSREVNNLAGECNEGLMHVLAFSNYAELLNDKNSPAAEHKSGRVVVTSLCNYSMPIMRYEIGDLAVRGTNKCRCGNILPTFEKVIGRITDHFLREDGSLIQGGYFNHLFFLRDWVKTYQVVQEDFNRVVISVVLNGPTNEHEKNDIESKICLVLGKDCKITWQFVDEIPTSRSGKQVFTKSLLIKV